MTVAYIAEIIGKAGVYSFKKGLESLKKERVIDFVIACTDSVTGGSGVGRNHAGYLRKIGADVLTTGECCFFKKDMVEQFGKLPYVLRPDNFVSSAPGYGSRIFKVGNQKIAVAVMIGQSGFNRIHANNPFSMLPVILERLNQETPFVIVDFHASTTAEKILFLQTAKGKCSAVIGSHFKVQTADEAIFDGTAFITDAGRTGSVNSVGGMDSATQIREFRSGIPEWSKEAWDKPEMQGVIVDINEDGKAISIERIKIALPEADRDREGQD
ncbi:MAG: YmdB family metallophosphoesterase [Treponema sp.]|nr:YmdB family metallophosphoesterase [Treponema sp.]